MHLISIDLQIFFHSTIILVQVPDNTFVCNYLKDGKLVFNEPKLRAESHPAVAESKTESDNSCFVSNNI